MQDISHEDQIKAYDADTELQNDIKYFAKVLDNNHIIHEGTSFRLYHLLQYHSNYLKSKIIEYSNEVEDPDDLMMLAKYDNREGNFYYLFDLRYLAPERAEKIIISHLDKKFTEDEKDYNKPFEDLPMTYQFDAKSLNLRDLENRTSILKVYFEADGIEKTADITLQEIEMNRIKDVIQRNSQRSSEITNVRICQKSLLDGIHKFFLVN